MKKEIRHWSTVRWGGGTLGTTRLCVVVLTKFLEILCLCSHFADSISHKHIQLSREPVHSFLPSARHNNTSACSVHFHHFKINTIKHIHIYCGGKIITVDWKVDFFLFLFLTIMKHHDRFWSVPGLTASPLTTNSWPQNSWMGSSPWFRSHMRTVLSREALKIHVLPG